MNNTSYEKFGHKVQNNGLLLVNYSLVKDKYVQTRAKRILRIPSLELASGSGQPPAWPTWSC